MCVMMTIRSANVPNWLGRSEPAQGVAHYTPRHPSPPCAGLGRTRVPRRRSGSAVGG